MGAGASKAFGIPDTKGFMAEFEREIGTNDMYIRLKENIPTEQFDMETLMTVLHDLSMSKKNYLVPSPHTLQSFFLAKPRRLNILARPKRSRLLAVKCLAK